jgi:hypothetical protein
MTQRILGFAGKKQSGKNTCANLLIGFEMVSLGLTSGFKITKEGKLWVNDILGDAENNSGIFDVFSESSNIKEFLRVQLDPFVKIYSFADLLKKNVCMDVFGLTKEQCYGTDQEKNSESNIKWEDVPFSPSGMRSKRLTARELMQYVGTDFFREMNHNIWVDATIRKIKEEGSYMPIICDCRFPNEVCGIQEAGGKVIRLTRGQDSEDSHSSETALDKDNYDWANFNVVIDNKNMNHAEQNKALYETICSFGWADMSIMQED